MHSGDTLYPALTITGLELVWVAQSFISDLIGFSEPVGTTHVGPQPNMVYMDFNDAERKTETDERLDVPACTPGQRALHAKPPRRQTRIASTRDRKLTSRPLPGAFLGNAPFACLPVEAREQSRVSGERDPAQSPAELDALEAEQTHAFVTAHLRQIELRHIGAVSLAGVVTVNIAGSSHRR